jgi:phosphoribosylanthranilate isomerase
VRFPWDALENVRDSVPPELILVVAGGLDAGNVAEVVERLSPDVVDVSSGVETRPGAKDAALVREFLRAARLARPGRAVRPSGSRPRGVTP